MAISLYVLDKLALLGLDHTIKAFWGLSYILLGARGLGESDHLDCQRVFLP